MRQSVPSAAKDSNATVTRDKSDSKFNKPNSPNSRATDMHKVPSFGRSISASSNVSVLGKKRKPMEECKRLVSDENVMELPKELAWAIRTNKMRML